MVDEGRVARLLRGIDERVARLDEQRDAAVERRVDPLWLDGVKYLFVTSIEGCIDVAHHIAASERWEAADTNAGAFAVLARHDVLEDETADRMRATVGFRNVLVHRYVEVDDDRVIQALDQLSVLRAFVQEVSAWLLTLSP